MFMYPLTMRQTPYSNLSYVQRKDFPVFFHAFSTSCCFQYTILIGCEAEF
jgi:hypothetical protein